jgi:hypothetical protein
MTSNNRFYHCYQSFDSIYCYKVDNVDNIQPLGPNFRLLFVNKKLPEFFDSLVLNYKYFKSVKILNFNDK